jgi:hypothetical protein
MNEEAYRNGSGTDLWIRSDQIWHPELQMRSANVWDMTALIASYSDPEAFGEKIRITNDYFAFLFIR